MAPAPPPNTPLPIAMSPDKALLVLSREMVVSLILELPYCKRLLTYDRV